MSAEATGRGTLTMTPKEVAERLGISEWWVREQIRRGRVPHLRFGRHRIALLPEHVDAIIELVTVEPAGWQADGGAGGGASGSVRGASGSGGPASGRPSAASGSASGDLTALRPTDRSAQAHRRRPHVQGDGVLAGEGRWRRTMTLGASLERVSGVENRFGRTGVVGP